MANKKDKMKKSLILLLALMPLAIFTMQYAFAEADNSSNPNLIASQSSSVSDDFNLSGNPGVTPDSPFYGWKLGWEKFKLMFTFNQEKKAEKELQLANLRLIEARAMAEKNNTKGLERAQEEYSRLIKQANSRIKNINESLSENKIKDSIKSLNGLERAIAIQSYKIDILKNILADENLTASQVSSLAEIISRMENQTDSAKNLLEDKKSRIEKRLKSVSNKTDNEINREIEDIEDYTNLTNTQKIIAENRINNAEKALEKLKQGINTEKQNKINISVIEAQLSILEASIEQAKQLYAAGNFSGAIDAIKPVGNYGRNLNEIMHQVNEAKQDNKSEEIKNILQESDKSKKLRKEVEKRLANNPEHKIIYSKSTSIGSSEDR